MAKLPTDFSVVKSAMLCRDERFARVVVPDHRQVRAGTLRRINAEAGMTVEEFIQLIE